MTSPLWRHPVTWRHRDYVQSIDHGHFAIGCPLEPSRYLAPFPRYLAPKLRQRLLCDDVINSRHLAFRETYRSIRSAVPKNPTIGSNRKLIGRPVPEIWPFEIIQDGGQPPSWIWWNRKYVQSIRRPRKPYPRIKHEVDRTIRCRDMAILNAKFDDVINDVTRPGSKIRVEH